MDGILLVDKPQGWSSFDVVNKVRYIAGVAGLNTTGKKRLPVGHTGTLDPLATGLLVLLLGNYTKRAQEFSKLDKTYAVTMRLGQASTTGDEEGEKRPVSNRRPSESEVRTALKQFEGDIKQIPPAYSAIKINGQRAYKLARKGKAVKLEARPVKIYKITEVNYAYPEVSFIAKVSSGTYIRSLVEDVGNHLGTGAFMSSLRRTEVGEYRLGQALKIADLNAENIVKYILPPR